MTWPCLPFLHFLNIPQIFPHAMHVIRTVLASSSSPYHCSWSLVLGTYIYILSLLIWNFTNATMKKMVHQIHFLCVCISYIQKIREVILYSVWHQKYLCYIIFLKWEKYIHKNMKLPWEMKRRWNNVLYMYTHIHVYWKLSLKTVLSTYQCLVYVFQFLLLLLLDCIKIFEKCSGKKCTIS